MGNGGLFWVWRLVGYGVWGGEGVLDMDAERCELMAE